MSEYNFGEIVLLQFPYTDNISVKKRPALILLDTGDDDIVAARVTSQYSNTDYDVEIKEWKKAGLLTASYVRLHKVATLGKFLIERKLGQLQNDDLNYIKNVIYKLWRINKI